MFPSLRQRLLLLLAVLVGAVAILYPVGMLTAPDGGSGLSLFAARIGPLAALSVVVLALLPAVLLGVLTSATGHPLSGVFVVCATLTLLAGRCGPISGWLRRGPLPQAYRNLLGETLIWFAGVAFVLWIITLWRPVLRRKWPKLAAEEHYGPAAPLRRPDSQALLAGLVCAGIGGTLAYFLLANAQTGQVIGGLVIAFAVAALATQLLLPAVNNPVVMLLSPALVAWIAYAYTLLTYQRPEQVLEAWYRHTLPGLALALPIHYASAAVAGVVIGIGWAQGLLVGTKYGTQTSDTAAVEP